MRKIFVCLVMVAVIVSALAFNSFAFVHEDRYGIFNEGLLTFSSVATNYDSSVLGVCPFETQFFTNDYVFVDFMDLGTGFGGLTVNYFYGIADGFGFDIGSFQVPLELDVDDVYQFTFSGTDFWSMEVTIDVYYLEYLASGEFGLRGTSYTKTVAYFSPYMSIFSDEFLASNDVQGMSIYAINVSFDDVIDVSGFRFIAPLLSYHELQFPYFYDSVDGGWYWYQDIQVVETDGFFESIFGWFDDILSVSLFSLNIGSTPTSITLGGILGICVAFSVVAWLLKMIAGG